MRAATTGYSLICYGEMITDSVRMEAYARALEQAVRPGCTVLDIGAGTGILSLLACRLGAGRVHAVEPDEAIQLARANAEANGCADRITFHQAVSLNVSLDPRADVIVSDLRGALPLLQHHLPAVIDARERLLAPGGRLIPRVDTLWAAPVCAQEIYRKRWEPWRRNAFGLDLRAGHERVVSTTSRERFTPEQMLASGRRWAVLEYAIVEKTDVEGEVGWTVERSGTGHGLAVWFDATLGEGIGFSNAPGEPELIYGQAFFPWAEPVELREGDEVHVRLRADLVGDEYSWRWRTEVRPADRRDASPVVLDQASFFASPLSLDTLRRQEAGHVPSLGLDGQVDGWILSRMDGRTSLEEIARAAAARFPEQFADWREALTRAGKLSIKYGR